MSRAPLPHAGVGCRDWRGRNLAISPRLWRNYVQFGEATVLRNQPGDYAAEVTGIPDPLVDRVEGTCSGFLLKAVEMTGGVRPRSLVSGEWTDIKGAARNRFRLEIRYSK